jgi:hypothetical protein
MADWKNWTLVFLDDIVVLVVFNGLIDKLRAHMRTYTVVTRILIHICIIFNLLKTLQSTYVT